MMRIIKWSSHITTVEVYHIGLWPFEYNNKNDVKTYGILLLPGWGKLLETDNYLLQNWFLNAKINFLLYPNEPKSAESVNEKWNYLKARFLDFVLKPIQKNDNRLDIPSCKDWEYAAFMDPYATEHVKDIKDFKGNAVICAEGNQPIELSSENLKRRIRPNSHGLYAMIGNVYELAEDYWQPNFMGGDISNQYNCKRLFENELEKVPFWGIRLAIRDYKE